MFAVLTRLQAHQGAPGTAGGRVGDVDADSRGFQVRRLPPGRLLSLPRLRLASDRGALALAQNEARMMWEPPNFRDLRRWARRLRT